MLGLVACTPHSPNVRPAHANPSEPVEVTHAVAESNEVADPLAALVSRAQLIVRARVLSGRPIDLVHQHELAASRDFALFLPRYVHKRTDLEVLEVLAGDVDVGEHLSFDRVDELVLATENVEAHQDRMLAEEGIFLLQRSPSGFLFGADRLAYQPPDALDAVRAHLSGSPSADTSSATTPAPLPADPSGLSTVQLRAAVSAQGARALPLVRAALLEGEPTKRFETILAVEDYGMLALMPELIALIVDTTRVPPDGDDLRGVIGDVAARRVARIAWMLDGVDEMQRREHFFLSPGASREDARDFWLRWWRTYREAGPEHSATLL